MVKRWIIFCTIVATGCVGTNSESTDENALDTRSFQLENYTQRVEAFLNERQENKSIRNYQVLFVNTEDCSACTRGAFDQLTPFLRKTSVKTFIYMNDSSVIRSLGNTQLQFIYLPREEYEKREIFHGQIYLYSFGKKGTSAVALYGKEIDSLNAL